MTHQPTYEQNVRARDERGCEPQDGKGRTGADNIRDECKRAQCDDGTGRLQEYEISVGDAAVDQPHRGPEVDADVCGETEEIAGTAQLERIKADGKQH